MVGRKTEFGELCKNHRTRLGLFLADQAEALKLSVSMISAIELGNRTAPDDYAIAVASYLHLNNAEKNELISSLASISNVIKFVPRDSDRAKFAFKLSQRLNDLSSEQLEQIRSLLDDGETSHV